jgi:hypothetical protein
MTNVVQCGSTICTTSREMAQSIPEDLRCPDHLWSRSEILASNCPTPKVPGLYGWYFRNVPNIAVENCIGATEFHLMYVGISPSAPPTNGKAASKQTLSHRIRYHMRGNAEGSTLRLSLGCILADELGIELRRVGSGRRFTFSTGESRISEWLEQNARVVWKVCDEPWTLEQSLIANLCLPLNLDRNATNPFHPVLSALRKAAKVRAKSLPVLQKVSGATARKPSSLSS